MAVGAGFVVFGYAIFYWGLHHFPGTTRYSLFTLLGLDSFKWSKGMSTPGVGVEAIPPVQWQGNAATKAITQAQVSSNSTTGTALTSTAGAGTLAPVTGYAQTGAQAVALARQWLGTPYGWGGGHGGKVPIGTPVDCSGLVNQVYGTTGTTFTQVNLGQGIPSTAQALPGDLVFFGPIAPGEPHHVGIWVGGNQMIDAPHTGTVVRQESLDGFGPINAIRRILPPS